MKEKLTAAGKIEVSEFNILRAMRVFHQPVEYSICSGNHFERGVYADGVIYMDGKQPVRSLRLIVKDSKEHKPMRFDVKWTES